MNNCSMILAKHLRDIREDHDLTQKNIANFLKIDRSTYTYYELGKVTPDIFTLLKLAKFYNVDISYFFKGIEI